VSVFDKKTAGFCLTMSDGSRKSSYDQGVVSGGGFHLRLRRITSSPSQTIRPRLVRRMATDAAVSARLDAFRRSSRLYFSHIATRTVYNSIDLYAVYAAIFVQNRVRGVPVGIPPSRLARKTRMAWLPDIVKKYRRYFY